MTLLEKWVTFCEGIRCALIVNVTSEKFALSSGILLDTPGTLALVERLLISFAEETPKRRLFLRSCFSEDDGALRRWIPSFPGSVRFVESGEDDWNESLKKACEGPAKKVAEHRSFCEIWARVYSFWSKARDMPSSVEVTYGLSNGGLFTFKSASRLTLTKYKQFIDESVEICDKKENCLCDLRSKRVKFRRVKKTFWRSVLSIS